MNNTTTFKVALSLIFALITVSVFSQVVNIPDANFKAALVSNPDINTNRDNEIQVSEAQAYTGSINVSGKSIADLTGIASFTQLQTLDCSDNQLTSLSTEFNSELSNLFCQNNRLTFLEIRKISHCSPGGTEFFQQFDARGNPDLTCIEVFQVGYFSEHFSDKKDPQSKFVFDCDGDDQADIVNIPDPNFKAALLVNPIVNQNGDDLIQYSEFACTDIVELKLSGKGISDLTGLESFRTTLEELDVRNNNIKSLDLTFFSLGGLSIDNNPLGSLVVNTSMQGLSFSNTKVTSFIAPVHFLPQQLICNNNPSLSELDLREMKTTLSGNGQFDARNCPMLKCISVFDVPAAEASYRAWVDPGVTFSTDCSPSPVVNIPDANFKAALVSNPDINTNRDSEIQVSEAENLKVDINVSGRNINDLTGIEAFFHNDPAFGLDCSNNNLTTLNLAESNFRTVKCQNNQLTSLSLGIVLEELWCNNNKLTGLDFRTRGTYLIKRIFCQDNQLTQLLLPRGTESFSTLHCYNNKLASLDLSGVPDLSDLRLQNNQLTELNVNAHPRLGALIVSGNALVSLVIKNGHNSNIPDSLFDARSNPGLQCIEVSDTTYARTNWHNVDIGVRFSTDCGAPPPAVVNIPDANFKAALLADPTINTNHDGEIQMSEAEATLTVNVSNKNIADLTGIASFIRVQTLDCSNNQLTSLSTEFNSQLSSLFCQNNRLTFLEIRKLECGEGEFFSQFDARGNPNLTCIEVFQVGYFNQHFPNQKDAQAKYVFDCDGSDQADIVHIPDPNLKSALLSLPFINENGDDQLQYSEFACEDIVELKLNGKGISDLTGLEALKNMTILDLRNNNIKSFDASRMGMEGLYIDNNPLETLAAPSGLVGLSFSNTKVTSFVAPVNFPLQQLICNNNPFLSRLDLRTVNTISSNNGQFDARNCPMLKCISVPNVQEAETYYRAWVDPGVTFSTDCSAPPPAVVNIPDANFKAALVAMPAVNTNGDSEIQVSEANAFSGSLGVSNKNISDLTGIEAFTSMIELYCGGNHLTSLNVSGCDSLQTLDCSFNQITSLDLTKNHRLRALEVEFNNLSFLSIKNGNNTKMDPLAFLTYRNDHLFCIEVDDVQYASTHFGGQNIDPWSSFNADCSAGRIISIPDGNFKRALVSNPSINTNGDTEIQGGEAEAFTGSIVANSLGITDLTGIESFKQVQRLNVSNNQLSSVDLSRNYFLKALDISSNTLSKLDISRVVGLVTLKCQNNQLTSLVLEYVGESFDVSAQSLDTVWCQQNKISSFNIYPALSLRELRLNKNLIKDMSFIFDMRKLRILDCSENSFTSFQLNESLRDVNVSKNRLSSLILNSIVNSLRADSCALTSLNIQNANVGPDGLATLYARGNPGMTCIQVNDVAFAEANYRKNIDAGARFSTDCSASPAVVNIPDANFKAVLVADSTINTNRDSEIQVSEANAFSGSLIVRNKNISDLTGIEAFTSLQILACSGNHLTSLNVSSCDSLKQLSCDHNQITSLDLRNNHALGRIDVSFNNLDFLSMKNGNNSAMGFDDVITWMNPNLFCIEVDDAAYAKAHFSGNEIKDPQSSFSTDCSADRIISIPDAIFKQVVVSNPSINTNGDTEIQGKEAEDFSGSIVAPSRGITDLTGIEAFRRLQMLNVSGNQLASINVSLNNHLKTLDVSRNALSKLDISQVFGLVTLKCQNNQLTSLSLDFVGELFDQSALTLDTVWCQHNKISTFNIYPALSLRELKCNANLIGNMSFIFDMPKLRILDCSENSFTSFQLNESLRDVNVSKNRLSSLILNSIVNALRADSCALTSLNIHNANAGPDGLATLHAKGNPDLKCVQVNDVAFAEANYRNNVDAGARFSTDCSVEPDIVNIPDANFKAALVGDSAINTNGDAEIQTAEAAMVTVLNVPNQNISELTGVGAFTSLTNLNCSKNNLSALDLQSNKQLNQLRCFDNQLTSLNLTANTNLTMLRCENNQLTALDVSANHLLSDFDGSNNQLASLNLQNGNNAKTGHFDARSNSDLVCIQVDDVALAQKNWKNKIDNNASFSLSCTSESGITVSPNPTSGKVLVSSSKPIDQITVFDAVQGDMKNISFDGSEGDFTLLPTGVYILKITQGQKVSSIRVLKK